MLKNNLTAIAWLALAVACTVGAVIAWGAA